MGFRVDGVASINAVHTNTDTARKEVRFNFQGFKYQEKPIFFIRYLARRDLHFSNSLGNKERWMLEFSMGIIVGFGCERFLESTENIRMQRQIGRVDKTE